MPSARTSFENERGQTIAALVDGHGDRGVALCSHFTGFKELTHLTRVGRALAVEEIAGLRFDYADCIGESEGACETMAVTHQVRDTAAALDHLEDGGAEALGLWGHSLGGLTALAAACEDDRVEAVCVVAAPARPGHEGTFAGREEEWRRQGYVTYDTWKRGEVRIPYGFLEDLKGYDGTDLAGRLEAPLRVIHPGADRTVPVDEGRAIHDAAGGPRDLQVLEGADHLLTDREDEDAMVDLSVDWFDRWL